MLTKKQVRWSKVCQRPLNTLSSFLTLTFFSPFTDWDLVFADDERESNPTSFKFMQMAHAWKQAQAKGASATSSGGASTFLSGFTPATAKQEKSDNGDSDEDGETAEGPVQRPAERGNDEDVSSSEDEGDED